METAQEYYKSHGPMTAPGAYAAELRALPKDLAKLCEVIQGVTIHRDMGPFFYDLKLTVDHYGEGNIRAIPAMLAQIRAHDDRPLTASRELNRRFGGVCRHFSLMLCAMLREQGVPARARCGFASYFNPGKFEDHWVGEYWNAAQSRWILVDAQLDAVQRNVFHPDFDPLDVPRDRFIIAGDAWQRCRSGRAEPKSFGLSPIKLSGLWFIAGNVLRDLAALNRMEMLPWDVWGLMAMNDEGIDEGKRVLLDRVATLTLAGDDALAKIREVYESDDSLRVPKVVFSAALNRQETITA